MLCSIGWLVCLLVLIGHHEGAGHSSSDAKVGDSHGNYDTLFIN
jgi:hypothetical protein